MAQLARAVAHELRRRARWKHEREDIDAPLFMAWRVVIMPFKDIELGFSRTAQFCGEQLECSWTCSGTCCSATTTSASMRRRKTSRATRWRASTFAGIRPIGNWPYAIYAQCIGEDESSYLPAKYLAQFGIEAWKPLVERRLAAGIRRIQHDHLFGEHQSRALLQLRLQPGPVQRRRLSISRARHRLHLRSRRGELFARRALTRRPAATSGRRPRAPRVSIATTSATSTTRWRPCPTDYLALELGWRGKLFGEHIDVDLGVESIEPVSGGEARRARLRLRSLELRIRAVSTRCRISPARGCSRSACRLCARGSLARARRRRAAQRHPAAGGCRHPARARHHLAACRGPTSRATCSGCG